MQWPGDDRHDLGNVHRSAVLGKGWGIAAPSGSFAADVESLKPLRTTCGWLLVLLAPPPSFLPCLLGREVFVGRAEGPQVSEGVAADGVAIAPERIPRRRNGLAASGEEPAEGSVDVLDVEVHPAGGAAKVGRELAGSSSRSSTSSSRPPCSNNSQCMICPLAVRWRVSSSAPNAW